MKKGIAVLALIGFAATVHADTASAHGSENFWENMRQSHNAHSQRQIQNLQNISNGLRESSRNRQPVQFMYQGQSTKRDTVTCKNSRTNQLTTYQGYGCPSGLTRQWQD